ncbi:uncharacterized protein M421DRAFT_107253 [Didymella exigua CBS 183.55]|uniref:Uncharacterized protein n=1 Tax=Didymella exigua CBS 183.55 TaxID=1150837 RepID=A0A6A5S2P1_9PLEO|nr:uncharacterized protein M421DRAFT_107253 [Didymella exigua CBS 183.55]KAF1933890.1 hypothetical protein M421DRAFT_107253 [Didymella exigua CBS 183.55]
MSDSTAALSAWISAPDWRALLVLNARFIRELDDTAPYPLPCNKRIAQDLQPDAIELQAYGFLVRYARAEWDSGPVKNESDIPLGGPWSRTQDRAFLHLVLPTETGILRPRIETLLLALLADRQNLEVTVLADWKDYPPAAQQLFPHHARKAQPERPSIEPLAARLEMFHSTVNRDAGDAAPVRSTRRTFGRTRFAATETGLRSRAVVWHRCASLPYETVDDVPAGSRDARALGLQIDAVRDARVLEIVVASKKFYTGGGEDALDLPNYVMVMCDDAGLRRDFEDCV